MVRISAIFIAVCMVLIAGSVGSVVYLRFGMTGIESALVALGALSVLGFYNVVSARTRDRSEIGDQMAALSRGTGDLARQLAELSRRLKAMEGKAEAILERALETAQPLAAEIETISVRLKELADTVAAHERALGADRGTRHNDAATMAVAPAPAAPTPATVFAAPAATAAPRERKITAFDGLGRDGIIATIRRAIDANRIELFLQPIVTLPQRKVRFYEGLSRLKADNGDLVPAGDFLRYAEAGGLVPKLDHMATLRCVQVVRRLLLKNRDVGLFCNISGATLTDMGFARFLEFIDANRAIAGSLVFEFTQSALRAMGPIEHASLAAIAERGFRFSLDNLSDLRVEPRELTERGFRFIKVPATLLLNRVGAASSHIHPADFSDLLGRFGIDLIAERIESDGTVVDLLDYDVRFGQGLLFSPPRPVRAEALQDPMAAAAREALTIDLGKPDPAEADPAQPQAASEGATIRNGILAQLARAGSRRG
jgi:cyclic-di-GMP phosphodiesterase TipF (flagellum assembly factor)